MRRRQQVHRTFRPAGEASDGIGPLIQDIGWAAHSFFGQLHYDRWRVITFFKKLGWPESEGNRAAGGFMRITIIAGIFAAGAVLGVTDRASGALLINEVLTNVPNGIDNGNEYVEITGNASESLSNVWLLIIDDDGAANGTILNALDLGALSGTVGMGGYLIVEDASSISWTPAPAGTTTRVVSNFSPDIPNVATCFALVTSFTGSVGNDLDTNDDGTIDVTLPWTTTLDAVSFRNSGGNEFPHADDLGGYVFGTLAFTPDYLWRAAQTAQWEAADLLGTNLSANYTIDPAGVTNPAFSNQGLSPGNDNSVTLDVEISEFSVD